MPQTERRFPPPWSVEETASEPRPGGSICECGGDLLHQVRRHLEALHTGRPRLCKHPLRFLFGGEESAHALPGRGAATNSSQHSTKGVEYPTFDSAPRISRFCGRLVQPSKNQSSPISLGFSIQDEFLEM
jgi:hypothetical protein